MSRYAKTVLLHEQPVPIASTLLLNKPRAGQAKVDERKICGVLGNRRSSGNPVDRVFYKHSASRC